MTKQQEIREGIDEYVDDDCLYTKTGCVHMPSKDFGYCNDRDGAYKCLTKRLTEIGVVIKVDRELPANISGEIAGIAVSHIHLFEEYGLSLVVVEELI